MDVKKLLITAFLLVAGLFQPGSFRAEEKSSDTRTAKVYFFELNQEIMPSAWRLVKKAVDEAERLGAEYILIRLNTYGGMVDIADSIRTRLLNAKPIVIVFIDKNAASAGALISIACDSIYMAKGASIGAATVVNEGGEQMPDKYQSYMRAIMRSTAEAQGRDPHIAESMVDPSIFIPDIIDSGKVLTFTTSEAIRHGFCEGEASSAEDALHLAGVNDYEMIRHQVTALDKLIGYLMNPVLSGILLLLILGGIYYELQSPGMGFPSIIAVAAAVLYFAPLYLEGLAANWEIAVFLLGIVAVGIELFAFPGFGVAGIAGITMVIFSLISSLLRNDFFDFSGVPVDRIASAITQVISPFVIFILFLILFGRNILKSGPFRRLVLEQAQDSASGYTVAAQDTLILRGKTGTVVTPLRPAGKIEIEGEMHEASTEGEYMEAGTMVRVVDIKGNYLVVRGVRS